MAQELIGIRECARRIGVSDTAVLKAIKAGRVHIAGRTETSNRPLVAWPQAEADWKANSDASKRSHVGGTGKSERRQNYAGDERPDTLQTRTQAASTPPEAATAYGERVIPGEERGKGKAPSITESKQIREAYLARTAKVDYEERIGKLVPADEVKMRWFKLITAAKTRILGIPAACKTRVSDLPLATIAAIEEVCRETLEDLANGRD